MDDNSFDSYDPYQHMKEFYKLNNPTEEEQFRFVEAMDNIINTSPFPEDRLAGVFNLAVYYRNIKEFQLEKKYLEIGKKMIRKHPVTGVGLDRFLEHYEKYRYKREKQGLGHAHNNFIHTTVESGIIGLAGLICFLGVYLSTSFRNYRRDNNPYDILVFTTCLGYICIFGQIDYTLGSSNGMRMMWFLHAVLLQLKETERQSGEIQSLPGIPDTEFSD